MKRFLLAATGLACLSGVAVAVAVGQTPAATDIKGVVKTFTLTPTGDVEGMILADGNEVHVPPHFTAKVLSAVHPGDRVAVRGWRGSVANFIVATSLTGQNGQSVVDTGPPPPGSLPPPPPAAADGRPLSLSGRVVQLLHGPAGDVNGALLDDETTLKLPPSSFWQAQPHLRVGQSLKLTGSMISTDHGRVVDVQSIDGVEVSQASAAPPPPPPDAAAPPPPDAAAPPPPRDAAAPPPPPPQQQP